MVDKAVCRSQWTRCFIRTGQRGLAPSEKRGIMLREV